MRLPAFCPQCVDAIERRAHLHVVGSDGEFRPVITPGLQWEAATVVGEDLRLRCSKGHVSDFSPGVPRYEVLFQLACYAHIDGYHREALLGWAAALERFYEFVSRVLIQEAQFEASPMDSDTVRPPPDLSGWWKSVSKQSERQLGSFLALWTREFGRSPDLLLNSTTSLRNRCAHQGYHPSEDEALAMGEEVMDLILAAVYSLQSRLSAGEEYYNGLLALSGLGYAHPEESPQIGLQLNVLGDLSEPFNANSGTRRALAEACAGSDAGTRKFARLRAIVSYVEFHRAAALDLSSVPR